MARSTLNKKYQALFQKFNEQYFGDRLPHYRIEVVDHITWIDELGRIYRKRRLIRLLNMGKKIIPSILIHEMAHAATNDHHAAKFREEMEHLQSLGAPIHRGEFNEPLSPKRLTKKFFKDCAEDALIDVASLTLWAFVKWFVHDHGYAHTPTDFFRRYPWARKVFSEAKSEHRELMKAQEAFRKKIKEG